jgi:hypothetical protein
MKMSETGMECEVAEAIKFLDERNVDEFFEIMKFRFQANHMTFNHSSLYAIIKRQLSDF